MRKVWRPKESWMEMESSVGEIMLLLSALHPGAPSKSGVGAFVGLG